MRLPQRLPGRETERFEDKVILSSPTDKQGELFIYAGKAGEVPLNIYNGSTRTFRVDSSGKIVSADGLTLGGALALGGEVDAGEHSVGFTEKANVVAAGAVTIDWKKSNKQLLTVDGNVTVTFTAPSKPCNLILRVLQSGAGHTTTLPTLKTVGGAGITISNTDGAIDIVALYYDGTSYYAIAGLLFS